MKFSLESSLNTWRSQMRKHRGFEDGDIDELEDHLRNTIDEKVRNGRSIKEAFNESINENYKELSSLSEQYLNHRERPYFNFGLLLNYLKISYRTSKSSKKYFSINLIGLVIGLTSIFYILLYLNHESNYDSFHENANQIYRVNNLITRANGKINYPLVAPAFGPAIKSSFSEIQNVARLRYAYNVLMQSDNNSFYEDKVFFADPTFFKIFSFKWLRGNQKTALQNVNTIILTKGMAQKYFGTSDPIGKVIKYNDDLNLEVVGIIDDVPKQSHISFDFLISFNSYKTGPGALEPLTSWKWLGFATYVQTRSNTNIPALEQKFVDLLLENNNSTVNTSIRIELQPLTEIYLNSGHLSNPQGGLFNINEKKNLISLGVISLLLIFISFFNYFNITAALIKVRTKEMGIRKVFGSSKGKIFQQIATETFFISFLATVLSWLILISIDQSLFHQSSFSDLILMVLISLGIIGSFTILGTLLFGSVFSAHQSISLLKGKLLTKRQSKYSFGRVFLLFQFGISTSLVMISLIVVSQLNFVSKKELGYESEGILVSKFRSNEMYHQKNVLVDRLMKLPQVKAISFGPSLDGSSSGNPFRLKEWPENQVIQTAYFGVDYQFQDLIDLELITGRYFSRSIASDSTKAVLINEKMAKMIGIENPIGKKVMFTGNEPYEIIGIFKDFHYQSLHHEIGPLVLKMWLGPPRNVLIKYENSDNRQALAAIEDSWAGVFSNKGIPFDYRLLDDQLGAMYHREKEFSILLRIFTSLAIFMSILGLFGLSSVNIQQKLKQIAVRRVLGAELKQITAFISKKFIITAILGILFFLPLTYYFMNDWLNSYAYSISLGGKFLILSTVIVLGITFVTLALQIYRVMKINPAQILKDE